MSHVAEPEPHASARDDAAEVRASVARHASRSPLDFGPLARPARRSLGGDHPGEPGTMLPPFRDHHVHLMIIGADALRDTGIASVVDLGGPLEDIASYAQREGLPHVDFAGEFLTAPGGYPSGRSWAAEGSVRELEAVEGAGRSSLPTPVQTAIDEQLAFGASVIKVALNSAVGPVFDRATLDVIVATAHARGLPVVAHVEGEGMSRLAIEAGVDALAHTPFTERVDDELVARAAARGQCWISTLHVTSHGEPSTELDCALDNLSRFRSSGGRVLYGTDLGNGDQPLGVNPDELVALVRAGLGASDLVAAITDPWPGPDVPLDGIATFIPGTPPAALDEVPEWLASAVIVPIEDLELR
ncbi:hypothetical protein [Agromyces albus]|uniref:hypothetical protein n=1 Tax=Agromyces albus TaxID=205332 RepID=UPI0019D705B9|nr:hypothetical protein [Agromyces albus]